MHFFFSRTAWGFASSFAAAFILLFHVEDLRNNARNEGAKKNAKTEIKEDIWQMLPVAIPFLSWNFLILLFFKIPFIGLDNFIHNQASRYVSMNVRHTCSRSSQNILIWFFIHLTSSLAPMSCAYFSHLYRFLWISFVWYSRKWCPKAHWMTK